MGQKYLLISQSKHKPYNLLSGTQGALAYRSTGDICTHELGMTAFTEVTIDGQEVIDPLSPQIDGLAMGHDPQDFHCLRLILRQSGKGKKKPTETINNTTDLLDTSVCLSDLSFIYNSFKWRTVYARNRDNSTVTCFSLIH